MKGRRIGLGIFIFVIVLVSAMRLVSLVDESTTAASQQQCREVEQYFADVDKRLHEAYLPLASDDASGSLLESALQKMSRSDLGILVLSPAESELFLQWVSVPGDTLLTVPQETIPSIVDDLHNSALELWLIYPAMFRAMVSDGPGGAQLFVAELSELHLENQAAQRALAASCPDLVEQLTKRESATSRAMIDLPGLETKAVALPILDLRSDAVAFDVLFAATQEHMEVSDELAAAQTEVAISEATLAAQQTIVAEAVSGTAPSEDQACCGDGEDGEEDSRDSGPTEDDLRALLPGQEVMPDGLTAGEDVARTQAEVAAAIGGNREAETNLQTWGWSGNVERSFTAADPAALAPDATTDITVSLHGFADEAAAAEALVYFSDVLVGLGYEEVEVGDIGSTNRLLIMPQEDGGTTAALYVQEGPVLYRIGGYSPGGDPTTNVVNVAQAMLGGGQ